MDLVHGVRAPHVGSLYWCCSIPPRRLLLGERVSRQGDEDQGGRVQRISGCTGEHSLKITEYKVLLVTFHTHTSLLEFLLCRRCDGAFTNAPRLETDIHLSQPSIELGTAFGLVECSLRKAATSFCCSVHHVRVHLIVVLIFFRSLSMDITPQRAFTPHYIID